MGSMRILKGLSSRFLACGCVAGIYETYDGLIIAVIDAHGTRCDNNRHGGGKVLPVEAVDAVDAEEVPVGVRSTPSAPH